MLYRIADLQQGYFTAKQAKLAGYSDSRFPHHVKTGNWIREGRGIYRLSNYPIGERPDLVFWSLWTCNREGEVQGVFSHETALTIHGLSDAMPIAYHLTVPKKFRKNKPHLKNLILHFANLRSLDIWEFEGYKVTTPLRTIKDIILIEDISDELILQAIVDGLDKGIFSKKQLFEMADKLQTKRSKRIFCEVGKNV